MSLFDREAYNRHGFNQIAVNSAPAPVEAPATEADEGVAESNVDFLRLILNEPISPGGQDSDTLFTDQNLVDILNRSFNILSAAAAMGWTIKTSALLVLSDRNDGLSEKKLSQLSIAAQKIANMWQAKATVDIAAAGRSVAPQGVSFAVYEDNKNAMWNSIYDASHAGTFWLGYDVTEG